MRLDELLEKYQPVWFSTESPPAMKISGPADNGTVWAAAPYGWKMCLWYRDDYVLGADLGSLDVEGVPSDTENFSVQILDLWKRHKTHLYVSFKMREPT